ncbi:MAG: cold shock domain-containing protein [Ginsengibacter sp.]
MNGIRHLYVVVIFNHPVHQNQQKISRYNMAETWNKKEREKKKRQNKKDKAEKKQERRENRSTDPDSMIAYIDENGNLSSKPPDPRKKIVVNVEDIEIGVPKQEDINPEDLIRTGVVTFFNNEKGYGFIKDKETHESVFVHINSLSEPIKENNVVSFETEMGPKGANAVNVKLVK